MEATHPEPCCSSSVCVVLHINGVEKHPPWDEFVAARSPGLCDEWRTVAVCRVMEWRNR